MKDNYISNKPGSRDFAIRSYDQANYLNDIKPKNRPDLYKMLNKQQEEKRKDRSLTLKTFGSASMLAALILVLVYFIK